MKRTIFLRFEVYLKVHLEKEAKRRGFAIAPLTLQSDVKPDDIVILTDVSSFRTAAGLRQVSRLQKQGVHIVLCLLEPPIVLPYNYLRIFHRNATRIYTWDDDLADGKRYRKMVWPQEDAGRYTKQYNFRKKKMLAIFCANKRPALPLSTRSLYGERIRAMRFFEKHLPQGFDIYGRGWDRPSTVREKILGVKKFKSWKGFVDDKIGNLRKYKFCICYENMRGKRGYVTEKIWDAFKARCVPIYWGAENIDDCVPKGTYIDRKKFKDNAALLEFMRSMPQREYNGYVRRIDAFITSKKSDRWFSDAFAQEMLRPFVRKSKRRKK